MTVLTSPRGARAGTRRRHRIVVRGAVQGVGFRPFVYRRATALGLAGWVANAPDGVVLEVEGEAESITALVAEMRAAPPPNAHVTDVSVREIAPRGDSGFSIHVSETADGHGTQLLSDLATCEDCLAELFDPADRRHRYPFINCTHCGPRYSIIEGVPYDRERTSMRRFPMCPACQAEYDDPADRRFHAEPNACPVCGPRLALWDAAGRVLAEADDALLAAAAAVRQGKIVAAKGLGGFHLIADARDEAVVQRLRERKHREAKPFAVMVPDLADVRAHCRVDAVAEALLTGPARPIVLLERNDTDGIAPSVAPGVPRLGVLLPYTPLHHLLMHALGFPVIATSGNVSDEPIVTDEHEALERLAGIADLYLVHDRPIVRPVDDSVAQVVCGAPQLLRRARGHAPAPIEVEGLAAGLVAVGGHLKAAVALTGESGVVQSQHLGDLETAAARDGFRQGLADLRRMHPGTARLAVRDRHPDYASTRAAETLGLPVVSVQHHVAHVAGCLAEHGLRPPALGVAWDGIGYGADGTAWGGEFLLLTPTGWRRAAHLRPFRLPGGDVASHEPRRSALGLLHAAFGDDAFAMDGLAPLAAFTPVERTVLQTMLERGINAPVTSSVGRLFDAVASLAGLRQRASYEGQAAAELEAAAAGANADRAYEFPVREAAEGNPLVVDWQPALESVLADLRDGADAGAISAALHAGLAAAIVAVARRVGEPRVALSGGCFQNVRLTEATVAGLRAAGFTPLWHRRVPPNDGGLAFGQAVWASWHEAERDEGAPPCA